MFNFSIPEVTFILLTSNSLIEFSIKLAVNNNFKYYNCNIRFLFLGIITFPIWILLMSFLVVHVTGKININYI